MFYPVNSLRKGGRFHLLWMADSYPTRFASVVSRQLWSQNIPKLCDDLRVVIINESGRPTHRYSLRLSSQLMRGLVRVYQRKVNELLKELCMIHASVNKHANKKYVKSKERENIDERATLQARAQSRPQTSPRRRTTRAGHAEPHDEQRVEEILQNNNNTVANIQDITLREAVIPEIILPNDGFGEEHPEQGVQSIIDRTVEMMLVQPESVAHRSVIDLLNEEAAQDRSRSKGPHLDLEMELMSGHDATLMRPSVGVRTSLPDFEKEIPEITDIQLLPIPEMPQEKQQQPEVSVPEVSPQPAAERRARMEPVQEYTQIELEELEELEPRRKRPRRLIIDKNIEISSDVIRARIKNPRVELRCDNESDVRTKSCVGAEVYLARPAHAGLYACSPLGTVLTRMYLRHLGYIHRLTTHTDVEEGAMQPRTIRPTSLLECIQEIDEHAIPEVPNPNPNQQPERPQEITVEENFAPPEVEMPRELLNVPEQQDISEMLTQKLQTLSQQETERQSNKRVSDDGPSSTAKKRLRGEFQVSQQTQQAERQEAVAELQKQLSLEMDVNKENVPRNQQMLARARSSAAPDERRLTAILQEAGLSDMPLEPPPHIQEAQQPAEGQQPTEDLQPAEGQQPTEGQQPARRRFFSQDSGTETPLGSLDRTRVSLGDSDKTTDSARFIRDHWNAIRTMVKIIKCIKERRNQEEITIKTLIAQGPIIQEYKKIIVAKCFSSILKLKQTGFIRVIKHPESLEIKDIILGPRLDNYE